MAGRRRYPVSTGNHAKSHFLITGIFYLVMDSLGLVENGCEHASMRSCGMIRLHSGSPKHEDFPACQKAALRFYAGLAKCFMACRQHSVP